MNNAGSIPATGVVLTDVEPANTSYVANTLNIVTDALDAFNNNILLPVAQPDAGVLPLIAGLDISSIDLIPPLPTAGNGTVSAGGSIVLTFEVTVNAGTPVATVISNQGTVSSNEYPDELTDEDGNDTNGDQPTEIIVGGVQQLFITKEVFVVGGGTAQPGKVLEYFIHVENTGSTDVDLNTGSPDVLKLIDYIDKPGLLTYVPDSARLNGATSTDVTFSNGQLIVNYDDAYGGVGSGFVFEPGDKFTVRYLAQIDNNTTLGIDIQGVDIVSTVGLDWGIESFAPLNSGTPLICNGGLANVDACANVSIAVGGAPGVANLSGKIWHDVDFDEINQTTERVFEGWEVQIYFGAGSINAGDYLDSVFTDANGDYNILGLIPNDGDTLKYALRFLAPGSGTDTASLGDAISPFLAGNGPQQITSFEVGTSSHTPGIHRRPSRCCVLGWPSGRERMARSADEWPAGAGPGPRLATTPSRPTPRSPVAPRSASWSSLPRAPSAPRPAPD